MMRKDQEVGMDKNTEPNEGADVARRLAKQWLHEGAELIPLALIGLEVDEPIELVADRFGEAVQLDDIGMRSVPAEVARQFLADRAQTMARMQEQSRRLQEALYPSPVFSGVPALSDDASPFDSLVNGDPGWVSPAEEFGQRPKPNFLAEELEQSAMRRRDEIAEEQASSRRRGCSRRGRTGESRRAARRHRPAGRSSHARRRGART